MKLVLSVLKMASLSVTSRQKSHFMTEGAASGGKSWVVLYRIFCERLSFVRAMRNANKVPTVAQLVTFLSRLEQQLNVAVKGHMDPHIKSVLQRLQELKLFCTICKDGAEKKKATCKKG